MVKSETKLDPNELLAIIKGIERKMGRKENHRWGPRKIDIDIIMYGDKIIKGEDLEIPHPEFYFRRFVLEPFYEIEGNVPIGERKSLLYYLNKTMEQICEKD